MVMILRCARDNRGTIRPGFGGVLAALRKYRRQVGEAGASRSVLVVAEAVGVSADVQSALCGYGVGRLILTSMQVRAPAIAASKDIFYAFVRLELLVQRLVS